MDGVHGGWSSSSGSAVAVTQMERGMELRRGPWTAEEDLVLISHINVHGEGRWNTLARCSGLRRTGKSCRLRWLNYLRPDVRRGNITPEEQLLILELHSRWGNRWSKIAQYFPGRTDNEIKNYWRTRVQKHAKQLQCDVNSKRFKDIMRYLWMPRLLEKIQAANNNAAGENSSMNYSRPVELTNVDSTSPENSSMSRSSTSDSMERLTQLGQQPAALQVNVAGGGDADWFGGLQESRADPCGYLNDEGLAVGDDEFEQHGLVWSSGTGTGTQDGIWSSDDLWSLQQQLQQI